MGRSSDTGRKPPRAVAELLQDTGAGLAGLVGQARRLDALDQLVTQLLPRGLHTRVQVANCRQGILVLVTPVAAAATRLRMEAPALLAGLAARGLKDIRAVEVRVAPAAQPPQRTRRRRELPRAAKQALAAMGLEPED